MVPVVRMGPDVRTKEWARLLSELRSRFLDAMRQGVKKQGKEWGTEDVARSRRLGGRTANKGSRLTKSEQTIPSSSP